MRGLFPTLLACALAVPAPVLAQDILPGTVLSISRDVDFPGGDLRPIYDTTLETCEAACRADPDCAGFTFNTRNGACFPKSQIGAPVAYAGALSGRLRPADPGALAGLEARLEALDFLRRDDLEAARDQALGLARDHFGGETEAADWRALAAQARDAGNRVGAMRMLGAAVTRSDAADDWRAYAEALRAIAPENRSERRSYERAGFLAAVNAALRARPGAELGAALQTLAAALETEGRGRDSIPALRRALEAAPNRAIAAALERARDLYGFRVTGTRVEAETEFPRICAEFSEALAPGGVSWDDFLQAGEPGLAVEAEGRSLCISGVRHGARYEVILRAGLPAASGEVLRAPVPLRQYVRDRAPSVRFAGRAYILPASAGGTLPIVAVNADTVGLRLFAVSDRNILRSLQVEDFGQTIPDWALDGFGAEIGEEVWSGTAEVATELNRAVTTRLPIGAVLEGRAPGLYALQARVEGAGRQDDAATQWFLVSDLGITALSGQDGLHVVVRGLSDTGPRPGVSVALVSEANRVLATVETDAEGYARFDAALTRGRAGAAPALLTVRDGAADFAFLSLRDAEFDLSDRGVEGREPAGAVDLFLTTERGAYRAGETIHAVALARDARARAVTGVPLTAILTRADGVEYARRLLTEAGAGGHVFAFDLGAEVPRGTWRLAVHADPGAAPLATTSLLVEDFLPERIDVALAMAEGALAPGARPELAVQADYLFGAPGAGLRVEGSLALRPSDRLADHPGYRFGRHDAPPGPGFAGLGSAVTDATGAARLRLELPRLDGVAPQPGVLEVTVQVAEGSGRPVERRLTREVVPGGALIGLRPLFDGPLPEGAEAEVDLIALGAGALPARWTLNRVETRYQWYRQGGNWTWEPVTTRERIATGTETLGATPRRLRLPLDWGRYELRVESDQGGFTVSSIGFSAGWYGAAADSDTPDVLDVSLDAASYAPGETARLRIVPRQGGLALVTVLSDRVIDRRLLAVGDAPVEVALPVTEDWGSGAYVTATLIRPLADRGAPVPVRALGLAHAAVAPGDAALAVTLEAPDEARPRGPLPVALRVAGAAPGETVHATIAAVDLGILNLTGFAAPDPQAHYFGQRRLGVAIRDVYGRLIDSRDGAEGRIRSGGDGSAGLRMQAPPPTEALVAAFSGPLVVGADGVARTAFDLPAFNGTVRLMAVAWSDSGIGQASADVTVRDPVVVTASLPRFLAPGDSGRLLLELRHADGPAGRIPLEITTTPGLSLSGAVTEVVLEPGGAARLALPVVAQGPGGLQEVTVAARLPDGQVLTRVLALPVQANDPEVAETTRLSLAPGAELTLDAALFAGLRPGSGRVTLAAGPLARFDAPGLLALLDRYPWGCTEQVTSQAMPLLYLASVAEALDLGTAADLDARLDGAIRSVLTNQTANGGFGLWGAYDGDPWLDAYVTDFLSRARAQGHAVPERAFGLALDNLANRVAAHPDFERGGEGLAYALMVLAREGAASMGDLRYYADVKAESFATPLALGQLGAALAMYGDQPRADRMFAAGYALWQRLAGEGEGQVWRADYGSDQRDGAGLLALAVAAGSQAVPVAALSDALGTVARPVSTQEAAWSLLATHALIDAPEASTLSLDGVPVNGPLVQAIADTAPGTRVLRNTGTAPATVTLTRFGVPEGATEAFGTGFRIARSYLTPEGVPVDPATVAQGTRLVAVLTVTPTGAREGRLMVTDPLPAGFEIDTPSLLQTGDVAALRDFDPGLWPVHTEFRQDRFLAAVDYRGTEAPFRLAYVVRAVTPGAFHHPAASVEDMYRPLYRAQTASGRVVVTE